jgi:hypothetical protein
MKIEDVKNKIKSTKQAKYGDEKFNNIDKVKETKQQRYDNATYSNPNKIKETNLRS